MTTKYIADCLDARYEEDIETLLVFMYIREMGVRRVLPIPRHSVSFKGNPVTPHEEMYKTAQMWKGKPFTFVVVDEEEEVKGEELFLREKVMIGDVGSQMLDIAEEMSTDEWILKFKTDELFKRMGKN